MTNDYVLQVLEALEEAGIAATVAQGKALAAILERDFSLKENERKSWKRWTDEDYEKVRVMYERGDKRKVIANTLDRSLGQINGAITRLDLRRSGET